MAAMRIIHTADWHLGNQMHDIDRREEAQTFLRWLKATIEARNVDTLIVAGDIFDVANPPVEARRLYYSFLASLVDTCCKNVVIIGGNHDSAVLLDAAKELLEVLHITVVGSINNLTPEAMCVELVDASGTVCGICLAVPFAREVELRTLLAGGTGAGNAAPEATARAEDATASDASDTVAGNAAPKVVAFAEVATAPDAGDTGDGNAAPEATACAEGATAAASDAGASNAVPEVAAPATDSSDSDMQRAAYTELYRRVYAAAEALRAGRPIPLIATGHLYAADLEGRLAASDASTKTDDGVKVLDVLGTLGNVPPSVFPAVDYVALGHIHYTTMVAHNPAIRYSGSPFVLGYDEAALPHYVLCVELSAGSAPVVEKIETPQPFVYRRLTGALPDIKRELLQLAAAAAEKPIFLELCYKKDVGVNAQAFLDDAIHSLPPQISVVSWRLQEQERLFAASFEAVDASEIKNLDDKEIFTQLILSKTGLSADSDEAKAALQTFLPLFLQAASEV